MHCLKLCLLLLLGPKGIMCLQVNNSFTLTIELPATRGEVAGSTLCTSVKMPQGQDSVIYINRVRPKGRRITDLHHLGMWACDKPAIESTQDLDLSLSSQVVSTGDYWTCRDKLAQFYPRGANCGIRIFTNDVVAGGEQDFPEGAGLPVGQSVGLGYLVVTQHTASPIFPGDNILEIDFLRKVEKKVGTLDIMNHNVYFPPNSRASIDCVIRVQDSLPRYVIGTHAHMHDLGDMSSIYRVSDGKWSLIFKGKVRSGVPMDKPNDGFTLNQGDVLAFRCTAINPYDHAVTMTTEPHERCLNLFWLTYDSDRSPLEVKKTRYNNCLARKEAQAALNYTTFPEDSTVL